MIISKLKIIRKIRALKVSEKCGYLGPGGHQVGCSCRMSDHRAHNQALDLVIDLVKELK
jgi:hypothetical protein